MAHWVRHPLPVLVLFGVVFGGLYLAATHEWVPLKKMRPRQSRVVEVTPAKAFALEWPRRRRDENQTDAPPLSLLVPLVHFGRSSDERIEMQAIPQSAQERFYLYSSLPDPESLTVKAMAPFCESGTDADDCPLAEMVVMIQQETPARDEPGYVAMASNARGSTDVSSSGPYRKLDAFWVKPVRETGRIEFVGWDCDASEPTGKPTTDVARPLLERNRCFEPASVAERTAPKLAGYQRWVELTACSGAGRNCKVYFPYLGRYVAVDAGETAWTARSEETGHYLFLAGWELVNRLHADGRVPPSAAVRLARAGNALDNCKALAALGELADARRRQAYDRHVRPQCAYAVQQALSALDERPAEAARVLLGAMSTSDYAGDERSRKHLQAAIDALEKAGQRGAPEAVQARVALAERMPGTRDSREGMVKRAALQEALAGADASLPAGSDTHLAIYRGIAQLMDPLTEADEKVALIERWREAVRASRGPRDPMMREPIVTMCLTLEAARRIDRLKECADEYLPFWLLEAVQSTQPMLDYGTASGGLSLLRWYSACGLTPDKAREVLASMQSVAALLEPRVRPDVWAASGARWMRDMENRAGGSRDRARK